jgi:mannose-6-phosphate isomerase-like protein (cupin superfamily)
MHPDYEELIAKAVRSHERGRNPAGITPVNIARARLYGHSFRLHTIGAFHATRVALAARPASGALALAHRIRAVEALEDLANLGMDPVPRDFRAVISTLHRYHRGVLRVLDSLGHEAAASGDAEVGHIAGRFREALEPITAGNGIHLTRDVGAPEQASFVVPNLGIVIVPLVYGDHHSWNLAYLAGAARDVPLHRHHRGVEIHLGYNPTHGQTVLGDCRAEVDEGYAMPIPPETDHGWINTGSETHHVPFIFGSLGAGGWGVFLDVEPQPRPVSELRQVPRDSPAFAAMVYLEREIARAESADSTCRRTLIPPTVTARPRRGGLELLLTRVSADGFAFPTDSFRAVSVVRGQGVVNIEGAERAVAAHDHFGIPAGLRAELRQTGAGSLVVLDAVLRGAAGLVSPEAAAYTRGV